MKKEKKGRGARSIADRAVLYAGSTARLAKVPADSRPPPTPTFTSATLKGHSRYVMAVAAVPPSPQHPEGQPQTGKAHPPGGCTLHPLSDVSHLA